MKFEKVSFEEFKNAMEKNFNGIFSVYSENDIREFYEKIKLPKRATVGSAGYDFFSPFSFTLEAGGNIVVPTGIRAKIDDGFVLMMFPRSGLGFKHHLRLANTVGIIDSDYYYSQNEGHIMLKLVKSVDAGMAKLDVAEGQGIAQGIFLQYGKTDDDFVAEVRDGGFGSTDKKEV